jgi:hypothetical protein
MIDTLSSSRAVDPAKPSPDERKAQRERQQESASKPGGFKNDPDDASNPNEVRERHLEKIKDSKKDANGV